MKTCNDCNIKKPLDEFNVVRKNKNGTLCYNSKCKICNNIRTLERYHKLSKEDKLKRRKVSYDNLGFDYFKSWRLNKHYKLTLDDFNLMIENQNGKCYLCEQPISGKQIKVDHNHVTGQVRKLLCHNCNTSLGLMKENPDLLIKAAEYLKEYNGSI